MKKLNIEWGGLEAAFQDSSYEHSYYLDAQTGETVLVTDEMSNEEVAQVQAGEGSRYIFVPKQDSGEGYGDMEDFIIFTVKDESLKEQLLDAIGRNRPFRRFKDVLLDFPKEEERWFLFEEERMRQRIREWLEEVGVEPLNSPPARTVSRKS